MKLRQRAWAVVLLTTMTAAIACALSNAWVTASALALAMCIAVRQAHKPTAPLENLKDWLIALEGKDPFDPDAKPSYQWQGFVTTFAVALRVNNHPTLSGNTLFVFRDEVETDDWRKLVMRVRHGAHTHATRAEKTSLVQRFFE